MLRVAVDVNRLNDIPTLEKALGGKFLQADILPGGKGKGSISPAALLGLALLASPGGRQWALSGLMRPLATLSFLAWSGLVVATMSNATNVTDGLDGLLAGLAPPAAIVLGAACWVSGMPDAALRLGVSHVEGAAELAVFCGALSGGCLGFLMLNRHPARIFMGDTGSMFLGFSIACIATVGAFKSTALTALVAPLLAAETAAAAPPAPPPTTITSYPSKVFIASTSLCPPLRSGGNSLCLINPTPTCGLSFSRA